MKVIHLISGGDSGGAKTHVHSLLQGLNESIQADMICFTDGPFTEEARQLGIRVEVIGGKNIFRTLKVLRRRIREGGYDIIHCHGARGNLMGALLRSSTGLPVVTTVHSDPKLDYMGRFFGQMILAPLNNWALHRIPYHIGVSDAMTDLLIDRKIVKRSFFSIYNGIRFTPVPEYGDRMDYLRSLGVHAEADSVIIGIAARLNPVKDIATLIRGFAAGYAKCPRLRLVIAGDGEEMEMLKHLAAELGVSEQVTFAGWISGGMDRFYAALDINALTSLSETFPYALTEGSRFRLATVASAVGGIPNLIDSGVNGFLFTPGDYQALGSYFEQLGNNDELRRTMGERLYEKASSQFSLDQTIRTQLDIYRKILADRDRSASRRRGVVLCGAYGKGNVGDESIMRAIVTELRTIDPEVPICIMTRNPRLARKLCRTEAVYTFNYPAYRRKMAESQLYINGGGSLIQNVTSRRSLHFYLSTLKTAHRQGCKVMMYGCGIGPVNFESDRKLTAQVINANVDTITLRDQHSMDELADMGVTGPKIVLAVDPTVSLPRSADGVAEAILSKAGLSPDQGEHYLGVTVRPWPGFNDKAEMIARAVERTCDAHGLIPVFIPIEPKPDVKAALQVASCLEHTRYHILSEGVQAEQAISLFSRMDMVLSMRLHALIFSAVCGVPLVGIVYDPKVSAFLDLVEQDLYLSLEELNTDRLCRCLDSAAGRIDQRDLLEEKTHKLLELEKNNLLCARELLNC
ncbi:MAG: polysaccharide pyruvyl transferase family protein [Oscillospiraceae bacterium]|nr:polysaccharide pyruvyl transferase family protein [Oscillospiraceae bacterium]